MHSIRTLIERIGFILKLAHPKIPYKKFGFINKKKGESKGVLKFALENQTTNNFMNYLIENYEIWISKIAKTDNLIKHKNNLSPQQYYTIKLGESLPQFILPQIMDQSQNIVYNYENIEALVNMCYKLINETIYYVLTKLK